MLIIRINLIYNGVSCLPCPFALFLGCRLVVVCFLDRKDPVSLFDLLLKHFPDFLRGKNLLFEVVVIA